MRPENADFTCNWIYFKPEGVDLVSGEGTDKRRDGPINEQTKKNSILQHIVLFGGAAQKGCMRVKWRFHEGFRVKSPNMQSV